MLPTVLTVFIFTSIWQFVGRNVTGPINGAIYGLLEGNGVGWTVLGSMGIDPYAREFLSEEELPPELADRLEELGGLGSASFQAALSAWRTEQETFSRDLPALAINREKLRDAVSSEVHPAIGIFFSALLVLGLGYLASGFLGRSLISAFDRLLHRIPLVRTVYPYTKQITEFFLSDNEFEFETVVAAPYPSENIWAIGFVTGPGIKTMHQGLNGRFASVFIPTSPMPMTGFTVFIEESRLVPLDITVDEALRVVVSAGVLIPGDQKVAALDERLRSAA
ncbi:MAG: DUF502 domain-containing protein [Planctomycetes bacterium]|nr:DUF502 domain-containing protein [Planctomycetota bacterium]